MEETWVQRLRNLAKRQAQGIVDAKIVNHRMQLTRRNGQVVDAGPIKVKPPGTIVFFSRAGISLKPYEPDVYITKDGAIWTSVPSESRFQIGPIIHPKSACWTGDRFMTGIALSSGVPYAPMIQSRDGGVWSYHKDTVTFNPSTNAAIYGMAATGRGLVVAVGHFFGPSADSSVAISRDFGDTWEVLANDPTLFPFQGNYVYGVTLKNEWEWVLIKQDQAWYTPDGGRHWSPVVWPAEFHLAQTFGNSCIYFNGYWWFYGGGSGTDEWDTTLIKSKDLREWEPVVTPWSGTYPPLEAYLGAPHNSNSGYITILEADPLTNTMIANGNNGGRNDSVVMMSTDGGEHWFEVGFKHDEHWIADHGWDGVYKWPDWAFTYKGGMAFGYGWWFVVNYRRAPSSIQPPMIRISPDGQITEGVYLPEMSARDATIVMAGGDITP